MEKWFCRNLLSCYRDFCTDLECNLIKVSLPDYDTRLILHWHNFMNFHVIDMSVNLKLKEYSDPEHSGSPVCIVWCTIHH